MHAHLIFLDLINKNTLKYLVRSTSYEPLSNGYRELYPQV